MNPSTQETPVPRAIGYTRVSTVGQAEEGVSLAAQEQRIRQWSEVQGFTLVSIHEDAGLSGRTDERPGLQAALAECKKGDALIVYSLTRLARSTRDTLNILARLEQRGVDLVSLSEKLDGSSAAGKMMARMLAVMAEFESDQISERTKLAMRHLRNQWRYTGGHLPYGFALGAEGRLVVVHDEAEVIGTVLTLRAAGLGLRAICRGLEEKGLRTRLGHPFVPMQVRRILMPRPRAP
ncbi:MAG: recombinase family protein [Bacteroidetes bacterium]|nr:recombinase family protein [Bacteroidota bacterium]